MIERADGPEDVISQPMAEDAASRAREARRRRRRAASEDGADTPIQDRKRREPVFDWVRRRRRRKLVTLVALAFLMLVASIYDRRAGFLNTGEDWSRYHDQVFDVSRVIDGDTIIIRAADGEDATTRVRFWGVNAPELGRADRGTEDQPLAREGKKRVEELLASGRARLILQEHSTRDVFNRLLAYPHTDEGLSISEVLLKEGLARAERRFSHDRMEHYLELEEHAKRAGVGIWSPQR